MAEVENSLNSHSSVSHSDPKALVLLFLQEELHRYFAANRNLSLNSLSKRCRISEPTLRRLYKGQIKTLPTVTTIYSLLSYLYGTEEIKVILEKLPRDIANYLKEKTSFVEELDQVTHSEDLSEVLQDPVRYLIFKLASNDTGVSFNKIEELFGQYGSRQATALEKEGLIKLEDGSYFGLKGNYSLSHGVFVDHFKAVADFIKPHKHANANPKYSPIFSNFSVGLNKQAYSKILNVQRAANKKIVQIMKKGDSKGEIPTFFLNAIDTLDDKCADEFTD